jgi:hypothetical protein
MVQCEIEQDITRCRDLEGYLFGGQHSFVCYHVPRKEPAHEKDCYSYGSLPDQENSAWLSQQATCATMIRVRRRGRQAGRRGPLKDA